LSKVVSGQLSAFHTQYIVLAAWESMRGGGARPRVGGDSPSDLLLKVAFEVAARFSLGEIGSAGADAGMDELQVQRRHGRADIQAGLGVAQT
jgi:hypothetical protein